MLSTMLNGKYVEKLYEGKQLIKEKVRHSRKEPKIHKPSDTVFWLIHDELKLGGFIGVRQLMSRTGVSKFAVSNCLNYMVEKGNAEKIKTGKAGCHDKFKYGLIRKDYSR